MTHIHKDLADGRWAKMSIVEQLANVGSEVGRAFNWRRKGNEEQAQLAMARALELIDLTLDSGHPFHRLREVARFRETLVDFFYGDNEYKTTEEIHRKYLDYFAFLARAGR